MKNITYIELISWCSWTVVMMHTVWWRARGWGRHGLQVSWVRAGGGVSNFLEDGCVLKFQILGWGGLCVCRSVDCCVSFHGR
jgi:hypothetical protein